MPQTKPVIAIVNVVASATIDQKLDLVDITKKFPDVEYHPEQFPGAVFRLKNPKILYGGSVNPKNVKNFNQTFRTGLLKFLI